MQLLALPVFALGVLWVPEAMAVPGFCGSATAPTCDGACPNAYEACVNTGGSCACTPVPPGPVGACTGGNLAVPPACEGYCSPNVAACVDTGGGCGCTAAGICGNGAVEAGEQCDDGAANGYPDYCCNVDCTLKAEGASCSDGVFCNGTDTCDATGGCTAHSGDPCPDDPADCNDGCNEENDACNWFSPSPGNSCDDGLFCNGADSCEGYCVGGCTGGSDTCDLLTHTCVGNPAETCSTDQECECGSYCSRTCTQHAGDPCAPGDTCDEPTDMCIQPASCGDGIVGNTPGETCDPPGQPAGPNGNLCRADCTMCGDGNLDTGEQCDDGNAFECDPIHPQKPYLGDSCNNQCGGLVCKDPSKITFKKGHDRFLAHGIIIPMPGPAVDFSGNAFAISLTTPEGLVFETSLEAGVISPLKNDRGFKYKNREAKQSGGIQSLKAKRTNDGTFKLTVISYGDLSQAAADMVTHIVIGSQEWTVHGNWRQTRSGWVFRPAAAPQP